MGGMTELLYKIGDLLSVWILQYLSINVPTEYSAEKLYRFAHCVSTTLGQHRCHLL